MFHLLHNPSAPTGTYKPMLSPLTIELNRLVAQINLSEKDQKKLAKEVESLIEKVKKLDK